MYQLAVLTQHYIAKLVHTLTWVICLYCCRIPRCVVTCTHFSAHKHLGWFCFQLWTNTALNRSPGSYVRKQMVLPWICTGAGQKDCRTCKCSILHDNEKCCWPKNGVIYSQVYKISPCSCFWSILLLSNFATFVYLSGWNFSCGLMLAIHVFPLVRLYLFMSFFKIFNFIGFISCFTMLC